MSHARWGHLTAIHARYHHASQAPDRRWRRKERMWSFNPFFIRSSLPTRREKSAVAEVKKTVSIPSSSGQAFQRLII